MTASPKSVFWLDDQRGYLSDWVTQIWVKTTGQTMSLETHPWLEAPVGKPSGIGLGFFHDLAREKGLTVIENQSGQGLISSFDLLRHASFDPDRIQGGVRDFYQRTSDYRLDVWSEWCGLFRPLGNLVAWFFSRRLEQLNIPLSNLETSGGITSQVVHLIDAVTGEVNVTAWLRVLIGSGKVLYAGSYTTCTIPGTPQPCVKVSFPLPNGNAIVVLRPVLLEDGSLQLDSSGRRFGDPGFYFTVHDSDGTVWARYVATFHELIHVFEAEDGYLRTDHVFNLWGSKFLHLHYRMNRRANASRV